MSEEASGYDAAHIQVLEGREAVRRRPGMWIGSTGERGLRNLVFEAADRAVNDVVAGRASRVDITLTSDGGVRVADDGPGVPVGEADGAGLEALLTRMPAPTGPYGLCGVGPFVVNALSSRLTAEVRREGVRWVQEYARGAAVTPLTEAGPATDSGTTLVFWPDAEIFGTAEYAFDDLAEEFRELAFLNRDLDVALTDRRRPAEPRSVRFRFPGGARDFVAFLDKQAAAPAHPDVIGFEREDPRMAGTVEVALRWRGSGEARVRSYANGWRTPAGGSHVEGLRDGVAAAVNAYARERRLLTAADPDLGADRIGEGLTAVVLVRLERPEFEGATRDRLGNVAARACVGQAVEEHLRKWLEEHPDQAAAVVRRYLRTHG
ncbi:ATP-binding protein [Streptomyces sp. CB01881]|uniref:ATP-binding protein n=1 Tax=Streptomyces sp. CB01881 TaxID=2078691 RepID=UPI000CDCDDAF|nr:ATP-binding protein [Streptomyces sp. CB01881]AUY47928.1 DNA gyrase subunit B [Streptomyces sp. CB01881]TYC76403.1 DNA gyrase subunit B [Streptomyces sp. CB01881]